MKMNPYLNFSGDCREAFAFYAEAFGGKLEAMTTHGETPMREHVPAEWHDRIMHAHLTIGEVELMGSDVPPSMYEEPRGFAVAVQLADTADAERIFASLGSGGTVTMPLQETFWAARFGMLTDRFGTPWILNCAKAA